MDIPLEGGRLEARAERMSLTQDGTKLTLDGDVEVVAKLRREISVTGEHLILDTRSRTLVFGDRVKAVFSTSMIDGGIGEEPPL